MHETSFKSGSHLAWVVVLLIAFFKQAILHLGEPPAFTQLGRWPTVDDNFHVFLALFLHVVGDLCIDLLSAPGHGREVDLPRVLDFRPLITIYAFIADYSNQSCIQRIYDVEVLI
jgi:hypothetical protein